MDTLQTVHDARITPAWAGKSVYADGASHFGRDHPRVGGEKAVPASEPLMPRGSPPRGRGKGGHFPGRVRPQGITPAWAGKSFCNACCFSPSGDHPRVGGEKSIFFVHPLNGVGSPPRGRGKD